ncbi:MAG: hypothetical protein LBU58_08735, partial [Clostridiales bacterium]|nr:hypothetical protein [Clostridiales bacterium]
MKPRTARRQKAFAAARTGSAARAALGLAIRVLRRASIYRRLLFSFMSVAVVTTLAIGVIATRASERAINRNISNSTMLTLRNVAETIDMKLEAYELLAAQVAGNEQVQSLLQSCADLTAASAVAAAGSASPAEGAAPAPSGTTSAETYQAAKRRIGLILNRAAASLPTVSSIEIVTPYDEFVQLGVSGQATGANL